MSKLFKTALALFFPILLHGQNHSIVDELSRAAEQDYMTYISKLATDQAKSICTRVLENAYSEKSCIAAIDEITIIRDAGKDKLSKNDIDTINHYINLLNNYGSIVDQCIDKFQIADENIRNNLEYRFFCKTAPQDHTPSEIKHFAGIIYENYLNSGLLYIEINEEYRHLHEKMSTMKESLTKLKNEGGAFNQLQIVILKTEANLSENHKEFLNITERK